MAWLILGGMALGVMLLIAGAYVAFGLGGGMIALGAVILFWLGLVFAAVLNA